MAGILVYSENLGLNKELLGLACKLAEKNSKQVLALTLEEEQAHDLIAYGADKVIVLKDENRWPESYARAMAEAMKQEDPDLFLVGDTIRGCDIAAQVAAYLQAALVSKAVSVQEVDGCFETERMMYGGSVIKRERLSKLSIVTIPAGKGEAVLRKNSSSGEITGIEAAADPRVKVCERTPLVKEGADLTAADRIVCVGLALDKKEDMQLAADLAAALKAELACTRGIAEERKWLPLETYIGLSGIQVKPDLYISLGVSGQVQHVVGIRDSKIIAAINNNEKAPIFLAADYGIVGDLYEIAPLLTKALTK